MQNIYRTLLTCLLFISVSMSLMAQTKSDSLSPKKVSKDTLKRNVEIEKVYTPVLKEAHKINTQPEIEDTKTEKIKPNYSVWTAPVAPENDSIPALDYALPEKIKKQEGKDGYLKLAGGMFTSFYGEAFIPLLKQKANTLNLYARHNSTFGKLQFDNDRYDNLSEDYKVKGKNVDNYIKANYTHQTKGKKQLKAMADFGLNNFDYYGYDGEATARDYMDRSQKFTTFDLGVGYQTQQYINNWYWDANLKLMHFGNDNDVSENSLKTSAEIKYKIDNGYWRLYFSMYNIFTSLLNDSTGILNFKETENADNYTLLTFKPAYVIEGKKGLLNIGTKGTFSIGEGRPASLMPDIWGYMQMGRLWSIYAGVTGDYVVNSYKNLSKINKYLSPDVRIEDTYIPIDVYVGSKINVARIALLDLNIGYKVYNNPYYFTNRINSDTTRIYSLYDVEYGDDEGLLTLGAGLTFSYKEKADLVLKAKYNKWATSQGVTAWMLPTTEFSATLTFNPIKDLRLYVTYQFEGDRDAKVDTCSISMNNISDLSLGANYKVLSCLNIFLNFNNLFSSKYDYWYGYAAHTFNVNGGISLYF